MREQYVKEPRVLIYDDNELKYYSGSLMSAYVDRIYDTFESGFNTHTFDRGYNITYFVRNLDTLDNIKLDDTTMKRIAKFNKNQECKRLDKEIKEKQEKIKELDSLLQDKEKRWNKVKDYIKNIYEINLEEDCEDWDYDD